jgi:uncharacterized protein
VKIRFEDIPEEGLDLTFSETESTLADALGAISLSPGTSVDPHVTGHLKLLMEGGRLFVVGRIHGRTRLQCSRCLVEFPLETDVDIQLGIQQGSEPLDDAERDAVEEDVVFFEGPEFDPGEIILQELLLALPMKPLCSEECPGLCTRCGALKGSAECTCPPEETTNPRWAALARLGKGSDS